MPFKDIGEALADLVPVLPNFLGVAIFSNGAHAKVP